ncbi:MAG TPA: hypothetical protein VH063_15855 [Gaiellaceae bacterium]|jgi:hypothetical protein|nr:hypothetical protein [Gaiellaceae bacterium]
MIWPFKKQHAPAAPEPQVEEQTTDPPNPRQQLDAIATGIVHMLNPHAFRVTHGAPEGPLTQPNARTAVEREANCTSQPWEWASHVYLTAHGELRWRCCANLFTDDHSPYCGMPEGKQL